MNERILKFLQSEGINAKQFALEIGVLNSSVSHVLSGRNKPSFDFIQKILNRYNHLNADWLILGKGPMVKNSSSLTQSPITPLFSLPSPEKKEVNPRYSETIKTTEPLISADRKDTNQSPSVIEGDTSHLKKVERVMVFYSDKTFSVYHPES